MEFYTIITAVGESKLTNAEITETKVNLTQMAIGDGGGMYYELTKEQTALINEKYRTNINNVFVDFNNQIVAEMNVPYGVGGFFIREIGVFDNEGDLIAIGLCPETYKNIMSEGAGKEVVLRMMLKVSSASAVGFTVDTSIAMEALLAFQKAFIGMPFPQTFLLTDVPGLIMTTGALFVRADWPNFWERIQNQVNIVSDEAWLTEKRYGSYSYGDGETTFRVPLIVDFVRGFDPTSGQTIGQWDQDQMQRLRGGFTTRLRDLAASTAGVVITTNGAFTREIISGDAQSVPFGDWKEERQEIIFDSANSPNARTGDETAPKHVLLPYYIYTGEFDKPMPPTAAMSQKVYWNGSLWQVE